MPNMALVSSASEESVLVLGAEKRQTTNRQPNTNYCTSMFSKTHQIVDFQLCPSEVTRLQRQWNEQPRG